MNEQKLLDRITINPAIFGGKPIIRGRRIAVEHILGCSQPATRRRKSSSSTRSWKRKTSRPVLVYARRLVGTKRVEPALLDETA